MLPPEKSVGVLVCHQAVPINRVYFFLYQDKLNIEGEILKSVSDDGLIYHCEVKRKTNKVVQKGQCLDLYLIVKCK